VKSTTTDDYPFEDYSSAESEIRIPCHSAGWAREVTAAEVESWKWTPIKWVLSVLANDAEGTPWFARLLMSIDLRRQMKSVAIYPPWGADFDTPEWEGAMSCGFRVGESFAGPPAQVVAGATCASC
jgi:hypothetical protein